MSKKEIREAKPEVEGSLAQSIVVFIIVIAVLIFGILGLNQSSHIHVPLIMAVMVVVIYGHFVLHIRLDELEAVITNGAKEAPFLILLSIGILIASWVLCGTVPYLVYLGLELIDPRWFLAFVCLMCTILSTATGSSWTTCGTLGVAFIGIAMGLNIPLGMTVGAICCGAFFGDKQSPISDYAVFAAGVAKVNVYHHARYMLYTSGPSIIGAMILFFIIGAQFSSDSADLSAVRQIMDGLAANFHFSPLLLLPLVILGAAIALKLPAAMAIIVSAISAVALACIYQGMEPSAVVSALYNGVSISSGIEIVDSICNRGGMISMASNMLLLICSLGLGGALTRTKVLSKIVDKLSIFIRSRFSLIVSTFVSSTIMSFFTGDPFIGGVIPCNALGDKYEELDLDRAVLSRTISDAAAIQQPIVPWGVSGVFVVQCFGLPVSEFFGYYFLGYLTPIFALILALTGIGCPKSPIVHAEEAKQH